MELLHWLLDIVLHLDRHLVDLLAQYDTWIYAILFFVIFAETGFVVTPFLPGDSLLFAAGALAAIDSSGTLSPIALWALLGVAAVLGNTVNYAIGRAIGSHAFSGRYRFIKVDYLRRTERFFERHGAPTIVLSRFAPIIRTFAPFVAGVGHMPYGRFQAYNIAGGVLWVGLFIWGGYLFGNLPLVKDNFGFVTIAIIIVSLLPMFWMMVKDRMAAPQERSS
ncbi:MAG TPA: DedA family protein [Steroidobacteraceae bacterium]|jgi:membrane-associated protein|nr:DedA family protein [Steroidobacteraceae bacterium]